MKKLSPPSSVYFFAVNNFQWHTLVSCQRGRTCRALLHTWLPHPRSHLQADKAVECFPTQATSYPSSAGSLFTCQPLPTRYGKAIAPGEQCQLWRALSAARCPVKRSLEASYSAANVCISSERREEASVLSAFWLQKKSRAVFFFCSPRGDVTLPRSERLAAGLFFTVCVWLPGCCMCLLKPAPPSASSG